jgi:hypothetical protein
VVQKHRRLRSNFTQDASSLCNMLVELEKLDVGFFFNMRQVHGRLSSLFWYSPDQQAIWGQCGDVVIHNVMNGTNRYQLPLLIFTTMDRNRKLQAIAQAILPDETIPSYS